MVLSLGYTLESPVDLSLLLMPYYRAEIAANGLEYDCTSASFILKSKTQKRIEMI